MGVAVSKVAMLTHCQALTQACNYCEGESRLDFFSVFVRLHAKAAFCPSPCLGETLVNVLDFKKDMGLWHGVLTVSLCGLMSEWQKSWLH